MHTNNEIIEAIRTLLATESDPGMKTDRATQDSYFVQADLVGAMLDAVGIPWDLDHGLDGALELLS